MEDVDLEYHLGWVEEVFQTPLPHTRNLRTQHRLTENLSPEHVLRGSRSFTARSFRSRNTLSSLRHPSERTNNENASTASNEQLTINTSTRPTLGEIASNNQTLRAVPSRLRPSPTPSLKRKKAEAIVKAHGSPTHVRVTARGRIVPSEQSPLCFPRFGYSAIKANGGLVKFAPNHQVGKATQWSHAAQDGSQNGFVAQDIDGRLCQVVNGTILPLTELNGALHLYMPAPNLNITQRGFTGAETQISHQSSIPPSVTAQANALELEYVKLEHELKDLDKTEVIHGKSMGKSAKDALVTKRRELVIAMDRVRKAVKALKEQPVTQGRPQTPQPARSNRSSLSPDSNNPQLRMNKYPQQYGVPFMPTSPTFATHEAYIPQLMLPAMSYMMPPPPFDGSVAWVPPYQPDFAATTRPSQGTVPQNDGTSTAITTSPRLSHALPLKDPDTKQIVNIKSLLNPMSPIYKPPVDGADRSVQSSDEAQNAIRDRMPTPLSFTRLALDEQRSLQQASQHNTTASSGSSIKTTDFFPNNARDHSMRKHEYPEDKENTQPQTVENDVRTADVEFKTPRAPPGTPTKNDISKSGHLHAHFQPHVLSQSNITHDKHFNDGASSERDHSEGLLDFSSKPREWIEGYQAGLLRKPVSATRNGAFLDGYCSGLLKSQPQDSSDSATSNETASSSLDEPSNDIPFELAAKSADCLKQAIISPSNEVAILTPTQDIPSVQESSFNLGAWQKQHEYFMSAAGQGLADFPYPQRSSSITATSQEERGQSVATLSASGPKTSGFREDFSFDGSAQDHTSKSDTSRPSGKRIISPLEWRTRNSLAGVAANFFSHTQYDGQPSLHHDRAPMLQNTSEMAGSPFADECRVAEISLDGLSPPMSPSLTSPRGSPPLSPRMSPTKLFKHSPNKASPTKGKLSQMAGKVGIKSSPDKRTFDSGSPQGKHRWKDLWKGTRSASGKYETS